MSILKFGLFDIIKEGNLLCNPEMKCRLSNIKPGRHSAAHKILLRPSREACTLHLAAKFRIWCKLGGAAAAEEPHCKLSFMALHCLAPFLLSAPLKHLSIYLLIICFPGPASVMPQSGGRGEEEGVVWYYIWLEWNVSWCCVIILVLHCNQVYEMRVKWW